MLDHVAVIRSRYSPVSDSPLLQNCLRRPMILNRHRSDDSNARALSRRNHPRHREEATGESHPSISFNRLRHLCVVDRVVHLSASVSCLPRTVRWPDAIVRYPVDAARYDLIFRLCFHWHMSLPRILRFSTALTTRRIGACLISCISIPFGTILGGLTNSSDTPGGHFRAHKTTVPLH